MLAAATPGPPLYAARLYARVPRWQSLIARLPKPRVRVIAMSTNPWTDDRSRRVAATVLVAAVLFLVAALVYYLLSPISLPWQRSEAHATVSADVAAGVVHVHGTTDLPDGARLDYSFVPFAEIRQGVVGARPASLPPDAVNIPAHQLGGDTEVEHGAFSFDADLRGWPHGPVIFTVTFAVGPQYPQPPQVVSRFGADGEHLAGPQVFADFPGARNKMYVTTEVQLAASAPAVTLVAPPPIVPGQLQLTCGSPLAFAPGALSAPPGAEQADHPAAEALRQLLRGDVPPSRPGWRVVVLSDTHACSCCRVFLKRVFPIGTQSSKIEAAPGPMSVPVKSASQRVLSDSTHRQPPSSTNVPSNRAVGRPFIDS
jgi:hypothetical protein